MAKIGKLIFLILALLAIFFSVFYGYYDISLTPFREAQTGITAYNLTIQNSGVISYQTPVVGYPWQVPFEFPLYQFIISILAKTDPKSIIFWGKLIAFLFFVGSLLYFKRILNLFKFKKNEIYFIIGVSFFAPIHLAYSPSLMIESFATFLSIAVFFYAVNYLLFDSKNSNIFLAFFFSVLSVLVKGTTWAGMAIPLLIIIGWLTFNKIKAKEFFALKVYALIAIFIIFIPLVIGLEWVALTDEIKSVNPISNQYNSEKLRGWNYGDLHQKTSILVWGVILAKQFFLGSGFLLLAFIPQFFLNFRKIQDPLNRQKVRIALVSLAFYLFSPAIFTNLHFRHDYYLFGSSFFLIFSISVLYLISIDKKKEWIFIALILITSGSLLYSSLKKNYFVPSDYVLLSILKHIEKGPIVMSGYGFSSFIPFLSERRALMLNNASLLEDNKEFIDRNKEINWVAGVAHGNYVDEINQIFNFLDKKFQYKYEFFPSYYLFTNSDLKMEYSFPHKIKQEIINYNNLIAYRDGKFPLFEAGFNENFWPYIRIIIRRGESDFYLSLFEPIILRMGSS